MRLCSARHLRQVMSSHERRCVECKNPLVGHTRFATGTRWAIATPHAIATDIGGSAFQKGGNAVDAALASAVALAVTYPHNCSVGGDLFALVRRPDGEVSAINASGAAPAAFPIDDVRRDHVVMPEHGPLPVTVPGAVAGWHAMAELGSRLGFRCALEPAVELASDGVPVAPSLGRAISDFRDVLARDRGCAALFLSEGQPLDTGDILRQPDLAKTLASLAADGPSSVYGQELGQAWVDRLNAHGSAMTIEDLAAFEIEITPALAGGYRSFEVMVPPPNSQGFVLLEILGAIEDLDLHPDPLGSDAPIIAEVFRRASLDRDRWLADPRRATVPIEDLLSDQNRARIARDVLRGVTPSGSALKPSGDTIALVAADAEGWAVSLVQSLYGAFGSAILDPTTGVIFQNRGACFSLDPDSPNVAEGGKRPLHTLMPVLARSEGNPAAISGSMGGGGQPQINATSLMRLLDMELDVETVINGPRWLIGGTDIDAKKMVIEVESRVPRQLVARFQRSGFGTVDLGEWSEDVGHAHLIACGPDRFEVASDPRADGSAIAG